MKLRKVLSAFAAAAVALTLTVSSASAAEVWSGSKDLGTAWSESVQVSNLTPAAGQLMTVNFTTNASSEVKIIAKSMKDGWPALECHKNTTHKGYDGDVIVLSPDETSVTYTLTANDAADIASAGLVIGGTNITVTSIDISDPAPAEPEKPADTAASYNVSTALVVQDSATWATQKSAEVKIDKDGDYTYTLSGLSIDPSTLNVLYVKDASCIDETPAGYKSDINTTVTIKSLKINGKDIAVSSGYNTPLSDVNVFDMCVYNIWSADDTLITLPSDTIKNVEMVLTVGEAAAPAEPATPDEPEEPTPEPDEPTAEPEESEESDEPVEETDEPVDVSDDVNDYFDGSTLILLSDDGSDAFLDASDIALTDIYGITFKCTFDDDEVADEETWIGGGIGPNSDSTGWTYTEWGRATKPIFIDWDNGTIQWLSDEPIFQEDETFAQLFMQTWGGTVSVDEINLLGADGEVIAGNELTYDPVIPAETEESNVEDTNATAPADNKGNPDTGVAGVAAAAGVVALAGVAVVVARKRK